MTLQREKNNCYCCMSSGNILHVEYENMLFSKLVIFKKSIIAMVNTISPECEDKVNMDNS